MKTTTNSIGETTHTIERDDSRGHWERSVCVRKNGAHECVGNFYPKRRGEHVSTAIYNQTGGRDEAKAFWLAAKAEGYA